MLSESKVFYVDDGVFLSSPKLFYQLFIIPKLKILLIHLEYLFEKMGGEHTYLITLYKM